ncbi:hypothetical protein BAUCODRAFT_121214 [Baudoinia panamericana UAMH 10762]|uniref:Uncharacterized protein n=1 Tax=Baudoinia panamericana (strain UAMH 10762) TaxID=717646 RepID=M2NGA7_BAUPA|nr:uncharacterized protein BAUCODRAFT_121214 [Baudoinia panamericana UAMH 10762]EMC98339.1 hypothetical protein BAUCODRAFT_121214 [Baudoinia panamericana UAMH 10762]
MLVAGTSKQHRNMRAEAERDGADLKRPLNSSMAFRKYYGASIAPLTQEGISNMVNQG